MCVLFFPPTISLDAVRVCVLLCACNIARGVYLFDLRRVYLLERTRNAPNYQRTIHSHRKNTDRQTRHIRGGWAQMSVGWDIERHRQHDCRCDRCVSATRSSVRQQLRRTLQRFSCIDCGYCVIECTIRKRREREEMLRDAMGGVESVLSNCMHNATSFQQGLHVIPLYCFCLCISITKLSPEISMHLILRSLNYIGRHVQIWGITLSRHTKVADNIGDNIENRYWQTQFIATGLFVPFTWISDQQLHDCLCLFANDLFPLYYVHNPTQPGVLCGLWVLCNLFHI